MAAIKKSTTRKSATKKTVKKKTAAKKTAAQSKPAKKSVPKKSQGHKTAAKAIPPNANHKNGPFCIVGIGASAGGLEALEGLFSKMPAETNMAFLIVQHLAPKHKSIMGSLLSKYTAINIFEMEDGMKIEPNCMYLNPPDKEVSLLNGVLYLTNPQGTHAVRLPIDHFFRSLAEDQRETAIGIILSGTGTDGTQGIKAIKGEGGMTMVQEEKQAKYDSMPRSAINTGYVDFILPVEKMPGELVKYIKHPYVDGAGKTLTPKQEYLNTVTKIFLLIRSSTGHDFSHYKQNTIRRRIERRMAVHQIDRITDYLHYLQGNAPEVDNLFKDMLITVTNFFRDSDAFEMVDKKVVHTVLESKSFDSAIRVWVPGCATGEEAYSLAMLFLEEMDNTDKNLNMQIFATDIDAEAVEHARAGVYPDSIAADVSAKRLKKFFTKVDNTYVINKRVREVVVFAVQNLIKDPPFSRLDLVSCRNVLIYMDSLLQKQVLPLFHYVLNPEGFLFLGTSESIGEFADSFAPVNTKWKIFRRKGVASERAEHPALPFYESPAGVLGVERRQLPAEINVRQVAESLILQDYAPPCVLLNEKHEIIYFHGNTDTFLSPPTGEPTFDILKMVRDELRYTLSALIHKAFTQKKALASKGLTMKYGGSVKTIDLIVRPMPERRDMPLMSMVIFEDKTAVEKGREKKKKPARVGGVEPRVKALEQELQSTKEYLQTTIEELETSNEELKSTNEELQSTNEELQSTNEEMETSKEELQSTNEELETVNSELQSKVEQLSRANNDLNNLLSSTEIGTIFLDTELCISRFTPSMTRVFNLIQTDIGRPMSDITGKVNYKDLSRDARAVLDTLVVKETEMQSTDGNWFKMRIMPYRTVDNIIDGIVLTFVDITEQKSAQTELRDARDYAEGIVETVRGPLLILDTDLKVLSANRAFFRSFRVTEKETVGKRVYDLGNAQWDIPKLRHCLEDVMRKSTACHDFEVEHEFPLIGKKTMYLDARRIMLKGKGTEMILLAIEDVTKEKQ
jgi:two-component system CheB/CheR fusion protein